MDFELKSGQIGFLHFSENDVMIMLYCCLLVHQCVCRGDFHTVLLFLCIFHTSISLIVSYLFYFNYFLIIFSISNKSFLSHLVQPYLTLLVTCSLRSLTNTPVCC